MPRPVMSMLHVVPAAVLVALIATSCAGRPDGSGSNAVCDDSTGPPSTATAIPAGELYLPTYCPMEALPVAQIRGLLVEDDGCLWVEQPEGRVLPLWPRGSRIERDGTSLVVVNSGGARAEVGTEVLGAGGEYGQQHHEFVVEAIGEEVPAACRGNDTYWLVYDVGASDK